MARACGPRGAGETPALPGRATEKGDGKWPVPGRFCPFSGDFGRFGGTKWPFPAGSGQWFIRFRERFRTFRATVGVFLPNALLSSSDLQVVAGAGTRVRWALATRPGCRGRGEVGRARRVRKVSKVG